MPFLRLLVNSGCYESRKMAERMRSDREFSLVHRTHATWERMFWLQDYRSCSSHGLPQWRFPCRWLQARADILPIVFSGKCKALLKCSSCSC